MAAVDFTDKTIEAFNTESIKKGNEEKIKNGLPPEPTPAELEAARMGDVRNADTAVGADGHVDSEHAPADPTARPTEGEGRAAGAPGVVPAAAPSRPNADAVRASIVSPMLSADELKEKAKNFAAPDVENGLWATLDKKMEEALRGGSPEEVAQNMTFAALTFLFDLIGNWADHHRREAKRVKKETEAKTSAYDHNMGVEPIHKNLAVWAVIAEHPAIRELLGSGTLDKEARKKVLKVIKHDPNAQKAIYDIVNAMTMRKHEGEELNKIIKNTLNMELGGATLDDVKGVALDQDVIVRAASRAGIRLQAEDAHRDAAGHEEDVARHRADRDTLREATTGGRPRPTPEHTAEHTAETGR